MKLSVCSPTHSSKMRGLKLFGEVKLQCLALTNMYVALPMAVLIVAFIFGVIRQEVW